MTSVLETLKKRTVQVKEDKDLLDNEYNNYVDEDEEDLDDLPYKGVGVEKHPEKAMEWYKKAAEQGHPEAAYNLALGQLKGLHNHIDETEAKRLIKHAADNNVQEAKQTLDMLCARGGCD